VSNAAAAPPSWRRRWIVGLVPVVLTFIAMRGVFTTSEIFFVRDLGLEFWPIHLWFRDTVFAGTSPFWDPYIALGQSAIADPVRQILFPPAVLLRLLLPASVGFNLLVALPMPVAAIGTYLFLRRSTSPWAACVGASMFGVSGPMLSTANAPNLSWSIAFVGWALWGADRILDATTTGADFRRLARRIAALAVVFWLQTLAGEPVTLVGTGALAMALTLAGGSAETRESRLRIAAVIGVGVAGLTAFLLAAPQMLPLLGAARNSIRGGGGVASTPNEWSLHPLALLETILPGLFGDYLEWGPQGARWIMALNGGRDPFFHSIFVGAGAIGLGLWGLALYARRRSAIFWAVTSLVAAALAFGRYNPLYQAAFDLVPQLQAFRYPTKFLLFAAFAVSTLAAFGWDSLAIPHQFSARRRAITLAALAAFAGIAIVCLGVAYAAPGLIATSSARLAAIVAVEEAEASVQLLTSTMPAVLARLLVGAIGIVVLLWALTRSSASQDLLMGGLFALVVADPLLMNSRVNPTLDASLFGEPSWIRFTREHPGDRAYIGGGHLQWTANTVNDPDAPPNTFVLPMRVSFIKPSVVFSARFAAMPSAWRLREALSLDLASLFPREYSATTILFAMADQETRGRFLSRCNVRYHLLSHAPVGEAKLVSTVEGMAPIAVWETPATSSRVVVSQLGVPIPDRALQYEALFAPNIDPNNVTILDGEPPAPAGVVGTPTAPSASISEETPTEVTISATAAEKGGYLLLKDTFDSDWRCEVDGVEAPVLRAFGIFRAVRIAPGAHAVRFYYSPRAFYVGVVTALVAAFALGACAIVPMRRNFG
jgi:hypothetical protein